MILTLLWARGWLPTCWLPIGGATRLDGLLVFQKNGIWIAGTSVIYTLGANYCPGKPVSLFLHLSTESHPTHFNMKLWYAYSVGYAAAFNWMYTSVVLPIYTFDERQ